LLLATAALALPAFGCGGGGAGGDAACQNGIDDDGDGKTDFPDDPGCTSPTDDDESNVAKPACSDGIDNDGDGKIDFPADPGCLNSNQDSEADDCPSGPNCPQCANQKDDDGDGKIDADDPGCSNPQDNTEEEFNSTACGNSVVIKPLPANGKVSGTLALAASHLISAGNCGGLGAELAYQITVTEPEVIVASTAVTGTAVDTVVYIRGADCSKASELACNNDATATTTGSTVEASVGPGVYFIIVDGNTNSSTGAFNLEVTHFKGQGVACDVAVANDCAPGFFCRQLPGAAGTTCVPPRCADGVDDDTGTLDTKVDYPNDPGCDSKLDDNEDDDCPSGPNCPACSNGVDDDHDQKTDYPADPSCTAASSVSESCTSSDPIGTITGPSTTGNTTGATNDRNPSCAGTVSAPDLLFPLTVPRLDSLSVSATTGGFEYVLELLDGTCGGTALTCTDNGTISRTNVAAGNYFVSVDGYTTTDVGSFTLLVSGVISPGGHCDNALFTSGALTCATDTACDGTICKGTKQCNDGVNNADGDTLIDYPNDPGCDSPSDDSEIDDCPSGPNCPVCANGIDDDNDQKTDYPADTSCSAASGRSESCAAGEPIAAITSRVTTGDTTGKVNDLAASCGSSTNTAGDLTYSLLLPQVKSLVISVATDSSSSLSAVASLFDASCGVELGCGDAADIVLGPTAAGQYFIGVDGYGTSEGTFTLTISGELAAGAACETPLVAAGVLACPSGFACKGSTGSKKCLVAACHDGINNDNDLKADYPNDPGCDSLSDDDESDDCPSGPNCPQCGNGVDDDGDNLTDYPADDSCVSASQRSEACASSEAIIPLTMGLTTGTTATAANDQNPTCASSSGSGPDVLFELDLPALTSLTIDEPGAGFDSVFQLFLGSCGATPLNCTDTGPTTLTNLAAGLYYLDLDGYSATSSGTYALSVAGTIASGGRCDGALALSGALTCVAGTACSGGTCH
jgi:hypothetical protein